MTKGSDLLVAALENEGVERIFGIPGEENLDVVESLRSSRIELVLTRHEQAAAFMAASIPTIVRDSFRVAMEERPGPVHLELPEDIAAEDADAAILPVHPIERPVAHPAP